MPQSKSQDSSKSLVVEEQIKLSDCEFAIEGAYRSAYSAFCVIGTELVKIRDGKLYRETHKTFEAYCLARWDISDSRANQFISAAEVTEALKITTIVVMPTAESQARELVTLLSKPDTLRKVWIRAVELNGGDVPPARLVIDARCEVLGIQTPAQRRQARKAKDEDELRQFEADQAAKAAQARRLEENPLREKIAKLRDTSGRTPDEVKAHQLKADELERKLLAETSEPTQTAPDLSDQLFGTAPVTKTQDTEALAELSEDDGLSGLRDLDTTDLVNTLLTELPVFLAWHETVSAAMNAQPSSDSVVKYLNELSRSEQISIVNQVPALVQLVRLVKDNERLTGEVRLAQERITELDRENKRLKAEVSSLRSPQYTAKERQDMGLDSRGVDLAEDGTELRYGSG